MKPLVRAAIGGIAPMVFAFGACSSSDDRKAVADSGTARFFGTCADVPPNGATQAPDPPPYSGGTCPTLVTGTTFNHLTSSGVDRSFLVVVPDDMKPDEKLPLVFLWYWLSGDAMQFYTILNAQVAVNRSRFIAVFPVAIGAFPSEWRGWLSSNPESMEQDEFTFFDDMLACISAQLPVNKNCVSTVGVSDGALWSSQLIGGRGQYLSSAVILSGGVHNPDDSRTALIRDYIPSPHSMPAVVLWGGPDDVCIVLPFEPATKALEAALVKENHFIIECEHNCGHAVPPIEPPDGGTPFDMMFRFVWDHPYWLPPGQSPYRTLPPGWPEWCAIGAGNATERVGGNCGSLGCPDLLTSDASAD